MRRTYVGVIQNDQCDLKALVLAENEGEARAKVINTFKDGLGRTYREEELQIVAFW